MKPYAEAVVRELERFSAYEDFQPHDPRSQGLIVTKFADGEMEVEVRPSVRGQDIYLFAGSATNPEGISLEECKVEVYHAVDALRRAQAGRISLFEPYVSSGRSDRTTRRNSVGLWVHYKTLIALGVNHIITYNLHSNMSVSMVDPVHCLIDNIPALELLKEHVTRFYVCDLETLNNVVRKDWVFCSADAGSEALAKRFASSFGTEMAVAHKQRDYGVPNRVLSTRILSGTSLAGKIVWIVDDILDTGRSVCGLIRELRPHGVRKVNLAIVHAVFSPPALQELSALHREGLLETVVITDTVRRASAELEVHPFIEVVGSARLSAEVVHRLHNQAPLSDLLDAFRPERYFRSQSQSLDIEGLGARSRRA
jgi:ribose-phosphate pyrophosphokinase